MAASPPDSIALDLGTGPVALFAIIAAELGAKHVYAIEANPAVAASVVLPSARQDGRT
jgi:predicted RNA methylase